MSLGFEHEIDDLIFDEYDRRNGLFHDSREHADMGIFADYDYCDSESDPFDDPCPYSFLDFDVDPEIDLFNQECEEDERRADMLAARELDDLYKRLEKPRKRRMKATRAPHVKAIGHGRHN